MDVKTAYFAGLIDGEGYIALSSKDANTKRPVIQVSMTCEKTIRSIRDHFLVGTVTYLPPRTAKHKPQWQWRAVYNGALDVARLIQPILITKKNDVELLLQYVPVGKGNGRRKK